MLNPFFLNGSKSEQGLMQDLINESLRMYGIDVYYIPRQYITEKTVIHEVIESQFTSAFPIEAYVQTYDGYSGQGTLLSKFGIQELDDLTIIISKERYQNYIAEFAKNIENNKLSKRPKEGDLIYFPLGRRLFEIKYVEHEKPFYQLQKNYVYELTCELFRYEDEVIDTGLEFIDDPNSDATDGSSDTYDNRTSDDPNADDSNYTHSYGNKTTLQMVGFGSTATATCNIVNGGIRYVTITNRGSGYTQIPRVAFSSAPHGGKTGIATAIMISGIVDFCDANPTSQRVQDIQILNSGYGYTTAPKISFTGGGGSGTEAIAVIGNGVINKITINNFGSGYINVPTVSFVGICSVTATAKAILNSSGYVESIQLNNCGLGYTTAPIIQISAPEVIVGFGTYKFNEKVVGQTSGISATVKSWNVVTKMLVVSNITGEFYRGEIITGESSGAYYKVTNINIENTEGNILADTFDDNSVIQKEANKILDFSEKNPFGTP
jgi:hypothetical protein